MDKNGNLVGNRAKSEKQNISDRFSKAFRRKSDNALRRKYFTFDEEHVERAKGHSKIPGSLPTARSESCMLEKLPRKCSPIHEIHVSPPPEDDIMENEHFEDAKLDFETNELEALRINYDLPTDPIARTRWINRIKKFSGFL